MISATGAVAVRNLVLDDGRGEFQVDRAWRESWLLLYPERPGWDFQEGSRG